MGTTVASTRAESQRLSWLDAAVAVGLAAVALQLRWHVPSDGLFFDDAWQALAAVKGSFSELLTVGQTQPGFGLELMVWSRAIGPGEVRMIGPALIAGCLGPPALYLVLRRYGFARSIAALLGVALTVSVTHILFSGRVKAYTSEVLFVLLLAVVVPRLSLRRWRYPTAIGWVVGSLLIASFSSFTLLATAAAGIVLVLHAKGDRKLRAAAVAVQALGTALLLAAVERTHNAPLLTRYFEGNDGYLPFDPNPVTFGREVGRHLVRITAVFPGGPAWVPAFCIVLALFGLVLMARTSGSRAVAARFMLVMVLLAFGGAIAGRVPFGPIDQAFRATLWLVPVVAFGLAAALERARRAAGARGTTARTGFDVIVVGLALVLLVDAVGVRRPYPNGGLAATRQAMASIGPNDAVLITRPTMYSFGLYADTPVRIQADATKIQGFMPGFADPRLLAVDFLNQAQRRIVNDVLDAADVVYLVDSGNDPEGLFKYRITLGIMLKRHGYEVDRIRTVGTATLSTWRHADA